MYLQHSTSDTCAWISANKKIQVFKSPLKPCAVRFESFALGDEIANIKNSDIQAEKHAVPNKLLVAAINKKASQNLHNVQSPTLCPLWM